VCLNRNKKRNQVDSKKSAPDIAVYFLSQIMQQVPVERDAQNSGLSLAKQLSGLANYLFLNHKFIIVLRKRVSLFI
jgi:hypothetical protein